MLNISDYTIFIVYNQLDIHDVYRKLKGFIGMDYLVKLEKRIKKNFPDITPEELESRMKVAKHLIAMAHNKFNLKNRKDNDK